MVKGNGPSRIGRDWLSQIRLNWKNLDIGKCVDTLPVDTLLQSYVEVFEEHVGVI